jgi:toxin ParE1/3/4
MKVVWSESAFVELQGLHGYLENRRAAVRLIQAIHHRVDLLALFPLSGRMVPEYENPTVREVVVGAFRVLYRVSKRCIEVIRVVDAHRPLSSGTAEAEVVYGSNLGMSL